MSKISLPYGMFLTKVFKFFKLDLNDEIKRAPKAISDEYNDKILKHMGYELKNNKWTPKLIKKKEEASISKEKAPSGNGYTRKTLVSKVEGFKMSMLGLWLKCKNLSKSCMSKWTMWPLEYYLSKRKCKKCKRK